MCLAILAWLLLAYALSSKPGWFVCLLVLLPIAILLAGCG